MEKKIIKVEENDNVRIDKYLKFELINFSREYIKTLCKLGYIKLNNKNVESSSKVKVGDIIEINIPSRKDISYNENTEFETIFENKDFVVINKPAGLLVHPGSNFDSRKTLLDILTEKYKNVTSLKWLGERPFLVHRLDKDTSGVMIVAKNPQTQYFLSKQFENRKVEKVYLAIVEGEINEYMGKISALIEKTKNAIRVGPLGRHSITEFKVISKNNRFTYLELYPKTGRTHQIRVHMAYIKHPIIGDLEYGGKEYISGTKVLRTMLHSYKIKFMFPQKKEKNEEGKKCLEFCAQIPKDFLSMLSLCHL